MTTFPQSTDVVDGVPPDKDVLRDLIAATTERINELPASYSGFEGKLIYVKADGSGIYVVQSTSEVDGALALFGNMRFGGGCFEAASYTPSSGAVEFDAEAATVHLLSLTSSVNADGLTFTGFQSGKPSFQIVRIAQDGTGGRQIDGGSNVNAGFNSSSYDFGGETITLPSGANDYVVIGVYYWGSGKADVRALLTQT